MIDNYALWERHDARQEAELAKLPKCDYCGEYIQDEQLCVFNDELICLDCLKLYFIKNTEDYCVE